jgi:hypothetical protein
MLGGRQYRAAVKLYQAGRFADALPLFAEARRLVGAPGDRARSLLGVQVATQVGAIMYASQAAAQLPSETLTIDLVCQGLALFVDIEKLTPGFTAEASMAQWERWARSYLAAVKTKGSS